MDEIGLKARQAKKKEIDDLIQVEEDRYQAKLASVDFELDKLEYQKTAKINKISDDVNTLGNWLIETPKEELPIVAPKTKTKPKKKVEKKPTKIKKQTNILIFCKI